MKNCWELKPNLLDCLLEDRIVPAPMNNLGMIVQTTSGLSLVTPFPGAVNLSAVSGSGGSSNTAASVSGTAMPTSMYVTGNRGISQFTPGNMTGNPSIGGAAVGTSGGVSLTIKVGSGADEAGGPVSTPAMSRTNPAYGGAATSILSYIGQPGTSSGMTTGTNGQTTAPVPALPPMGVVIPGSPTGPEQPSAGPTNSAGAGTQLGAPRMLRGLGASLIPTLPGGLGVGTNPSMTPSGSGGY